MQSKGLFLLLGCSHNFFAARIGSSPSKVQDRSPAAVPTSSALELSDEVFAFASKDMFETITPEDAIVNEAGKQPAEWHKETISYEHRASFEKILASWRASLLAALEVEGEEEFRRRYPKFEPEMRAYDTYGIDVRDGSPLVDKSEDRFPVTIEIKLPLRSSRLNGHAACNFQQSEGKCPCSSLFNALVEECSKHTASKTVLGWIRYKVRKEEHKDCKELVTELWAGQDPKAPLAGYKTFLIPEDFGILPIFWAGFSWALGTRQVLDYLVASISKHLRHVLHKKGDVEPYVMHDIEHADHPIGKVMRRRNWDRQCHKSGHDSLLWVALSRQFAQGVANRAVELNSGRYWAESFWRRQVYIAVNYDLAKLKTTFLFVHELQSLSPLWEVHVLDFKNSCSQELVSEIKSRIPRWPDQAVLGRSPTTIYCHHANEDDAWCTNTNNDDKEEESCVMYHFGKSCDRGTTADFDPKVRCCSCGGGVRKRVVAPPPPPDPEKVTPGARQDFLDQKRDFMMRSILRQAATDIRKLEECHTSGIVWKTKQSGAPKTSKALSVANCQEICDEDRECSHFNYHQDNTCEILRRDDDLYYTHGNVSIVSGRSQRTRRC